MADRIVVLDAGRISQVGAPLELYHKPANLFVAGFIGTPKMNFLPARCIGAGPEGVRVECLGQDLLVPVEPRPGIAGETVTIGIRPEHLSLGPGDMVLDLLPDVVERLGINTVAHARIEGAGTVAALLQGSAQVFAGKPARLSFRAGDSYLFDGEGMAFERRVDASAQMPMAL